MRRQIQKNGSTVVEQVAEGVKALIRRQRLKPGDALPSYRTLSRDLAVSYVTVKLGMDLLAGQGIVRRQTGQGCFVSRDLAPGNTPLRHVGLIYPASRLSLFTKNAYLTDVMHGLMQAAPPEADLHIFSMHEKGMVSASQLAELGVDGAILLCVENDDYLRIFSSWGTPGVVVDYCPRDVPLDYVACDNAAAADLMAGHLASLGHRRVICMGCEHVIMTKRTSQHVKMLESDSSDVRERWTEGLRALRERGMLAGEIRLPPQFGGWAGSGVEQFLRCWKPGGQRPTVIMASVAGELPEFFAALEANGIRIPEDLSFCTLAGDPAVQHRSRVVTTCWYDFTGMGKQAMELLLTRCRKPDDARFVGCRAAAQLVAGGTVRRVKG